MKLYLLLFLVSSALSVNIPSSNRGSHPYEFVRTGNGRVNQLGSKAPNGQTQFNRLKTNANPTPAAKKTNGVPPYAVSMEPLVKYSQPDPLYSEGKVSVDESKASLSKKSELKIKKEESKEEVKKQIAAKSAHIYEDSVVEGTHHIPQEIEYSAPGVLYEEPIPEPPEPIIEIIIKESNQSLPTPPPPPPPPKKKKEHVQVFYVKYKKDPHSLYGEDKIIYDPPVPAVTPPTNNADHHEEEEEEYLQHHQHHHEEVTLPPRPSTTLKAIIRPDSETYHTKGGVKITFGRPLPEESGHGSSHHDHHGGHHDHHGGGGGGGGGYNDNHHHHHHHRDDYEESAPKPSVLLPPKPKPAIIPRINSVSQLTKRNPAPFQAPTQPPQQSFHSGPTIAPQREFNRATPLPLFQQTPQFPAQQFKPQVPQLPKIQPSNPPLLPTPARPNPTLRYSTLPQHFQQFPKPQQSFSFPPPRGNPPSPQPPQQPIPQATVQGQQYYSINQPNFKSTFHVNVRPTPPQTYQTISNQAQQSFPRSQAFPPNPPPPSFHQPNKPFPQPNHSFPPQPNSLPQPSPTFSQTPQHVIGPIIQTHQAPIVPPQNGFGNRQSLPPSQHHIQQHQQTHHHQQQQHQQTHHHQQQQHQQTHHHQQQQHHQPHQQQLHQHQQLHQQHQFQQQQQIQQQQQFHQQQLQAQQLQHQQKQQQHHQQVEQLNRLQQQQQRLQTQILDQQKQNFLNQQKYQTTYAPEIIRSVSPELPFTSHRFETRKPQTLPTTRPHFVPTVKPNVHYTTKVTTQSVKKQTQTTPPPIEYATLDPKKAEEEKRKKEERKKQNVAALPKEVPDDLREQLLSSGILGNADIQILDYDKIGDIPIESLPPEALANFQAVAGSEPVPSIVRPGARPDDAVAEASEQSSVIVSPNAPAGDLMEMKVVRYNPDSKEGVQVASQYVKEGATQLEPVVLNDSKYNRYLPLKVAGAQFPVPDVPELRGKNVTSVVVLAPVDYEFLHQHKDVVEETRAGRRSSHPVLEVQGVHFVAGDVLKTLVKRPTAENYRKWLEKENKTPLEKQSVVLLVIEPKNNSTGQEKEIFMYDIGTQKVNKLSGELSAQFVEVAESNSENDDLEEISDSPGGDFTVKDTSQVPSTHVRTQRKATGFIIARKNKSKVSPR